MHPPPKAKGAFAGPTDGERSKQAASVWRALTLAEEAQYGGSATEQPRWPRRQGACSAGAPATDFLLGIR